MRRAIGLNLQQSKQTVPHFYVRTSIDADPLLGYYREQKTATNCTLNDLIVLAVARTIREFPAVRSQIVGNEIVEYPHANIGIAVGIDDGLVVPVVTDVDTLPLAGVAAETKRVVEQARKGRLENIGKGHFTISNLGMFGVEEFSAIINPPESGILAVSAARETVIVENGAMRAGRTMTMTLSADHRIVDGVMAAKFMQRLQQVLEAPAKELA
jgi:pyruvate dehydrogenase E2 component (dihydrolipoamide acetyltransferase)